MLIPSRRMKFALVSNVLPPSESAHAAIIYRLLRDLDPETYCLLSSADYTHDNGPNYTGRLPGKYYHLPPSFQFTRGHRFGLRSLREKVNLAIGVVLRSRTISRILKDEGCDTVIVCTGGREILDFPAAYLASRFRGARFYAYLLDQYSHMVSYVLGNSYLRHLESRILKGATAVIVPNEFLRDELRRRFNVEAVVIHNMCDVDLYEQSPVTEPNKSDKTEIVYTGGIGPLHYDAFRNLQAAIKLLERKNVRLHLYTPQARDSIEKQGIAGPYLVFHEYQPVSAMPRIQQRADILFLALAINSPHPDIVRTAMPGKMGEYLASGRPILVHAPPDSFVASYFRQHECGLVVDQNDPSQLARAIDSLLNDANLRETFGNRARDRAKADFDQVKEQARFTALLQEGLSISAHA
jgi:glycosyltransferase involved in cell wall biosynthesis